MVIVLNVGGFIGTFKFEYKINTALSMKRLQSFLFVLTFFSNFIILFSLCFLFLLFSFASFY